MNEPKKTSAVDGFIRSAKKWQDEMALLREILLDSGMEETVKWRHPCYMHKNHNVAIIQDFKEYYAILFVKGVLMDDPHQLLIPVGESASQRQLRFNNLETLKEQQEIIQRYIHIAMILEEKGTKLESTKIETLEMPTELLERFEEDNVYENAFRALTPGRQKAYIFHFNKAKKSETRRLRIDKALPTILEGLGPNGR